MLSQFKSSTIFIVIFSIGNLSLINSTSASKTKGLEENPPKVITQNSVSDRWETLAIEPGLNLLKSYIFFQDRFTIARKNKNPLPGAQQVDNVIDDLGQGLQRFFRAVSSNTEATQTIQNLSLYPQQIELTAEQAKFMREVASGNVRYKLVRFGTTVTVVSGASYVCAKEICLVEVRR
jgi:hypothetical protein